MNSENYRTLLTVLETGSLTAAAQTLHYTSSGVSRMMTALEEELGFALLIRGKKGVEPTKECEAMLPAIRVFLHAEESLRGTAAEISGVCTGSVCIGTAYDCYYGWIAGMTRAFHERFPEVQISIRSGYSTELVEAMNRREMDICFVSRREGEHCFLPLCEDQLVVLLPKEHPMAQLEAFPIERLETEPFITTFPGKDVDNHRFLEQYSIRPENVCSTVDTLATCAMVEASLGISVMNRLTCHSFRDRVALLPLDPPQTVEIGVASLSEKSPAAKAFYEFMLPRLGELRECILI